MPRLLFAFSGLLIGSSLTGPAMGQITYLSRDSFIGYFERDVDAFRNEVVFEVSDARQSQTGDPFQEVLVYPTSATPFEGQTSVGQDSQLFSDAIVFGSRAVAVENVTSTLTGPYTAGALSTFDVTFRVDEPTPFTIQGTNFEASASNRPGTTVFSLTGPGVDYSTSSSIISHAGVFDGTYTLSATIESLGSYTDDFLTGINRVRGENLAFDFLLLLESTVVGLAGDYNDSGSVEQGDLDLVLNNWGGPRGAWSNADGFTSGGVDQEELDRVLNNWGSSSAPAFRGVSVPEPVAALGLLGLAMFKRRR